VREGVKKLKFIINGLDLHVNIDERDFRVKFLRHNCQNRAKYAAGVYLLWNKKDTVVYVGQSNNIRKRILEHKAVHYNWKWTKMSFIEENNLNYRLITEALLISHFTPLYNKLGIDDGSMINTQTVDDRGVN